MLDLEELQVFVSVARAESFAAAARQLDIPTSTVSRRVANLEDRLGARLFTRTTRSVTVTDVGRAFIPRARQLLEHAVEAEQSVRSMASEPTGLLRVTGPVLFCQTFLHDIVRDWVDRYPDVEGEIVSTDRKVDLVAEGFDVAIREFPRHDTGLIARTLGIGESLMVASPEYLEERGRPARPADLADHDCIVFNFGRSGNRWRVGEEELEVSGRLKANDPHIALQWAIAGQGIARTARFLAREHLLAGELEVVLPNEEPGKSPLAVVYPSSRHLSPKVRTFVDLLYERVETTLL